MVIKVSRLFFVVALIAVFYSPAIAQIEVSPGGRSGATFLGRVSSNGNDNFYIFGGQGQANSSNSGWLSDVWRWRFNLSWAWEAGSNTINEAPVYGTKGVEGATNTPGARSGSVSWSDGVGNFYLFGGQLPDGSLTNDLWRFRTSTKQWTWLSGSNTPSTLGVYGTQGQYDINNAPGARIGAVAFNNNTSGKLWLFGGKNGTVYFNDLWNFDLTTNQWMWVSGSNNGNQTSTQSGRTGIPGGRSYSTGWVVAGSLWLFGGEGFATQQPSGLLNELYSFDIFKLEWRKISGSSMVNMDSQLLFNVPDTIPPSSRAGAVGWLSNDRNDLFIFGGFGITTKNGSVPGFLNDVVRFHISTGQWTWVSGSDMINMPGVYGDKGVADISNVPGCRWTPAAFTDSNGLLYLFGGADINNKYLNDLWRFDPASFTWTWLLGSNSIDAIGTYATFPRIVPDGVYGVVAQLDQSTSTVFMPGTLPSKGNSIELWQYNILTDRWTLPNVATSSSPDNRYLPAAWMDTNGNYWTFGGYSYPHNGVNGYFNDLWRYQRSTREWTLMSGNSTLNNPGVYGPKGTPSADYFPSARYSPTFWQTVDGKFWLFGGSPTMGINYFNDLWCFDPATNEWTWVSGPDTLNGYSTLGNRGDASVDYIPGARIGGMTWVDDTGNLWLFGGYGYDLQKFGYLHDVWKYNRLTNEWAWMGGRSNATTGQYGDKTIPSSANVPPPRVAGATWTSPGYFWLFGGTGEGAGNYNDLWRYDFKKNEWAWMNGNSSSVLTTVDTMSYGQIGVPSSSASPSPRSYAAFWQEDDYFYLFGGSLNIYTYQDMWRYQVSSNQWTWLGGKFGLLNSVLGNSVDQCQNYVDNTLCVDYDACSPESVCMGGVCTALSSKSCSGFDCLTQALCYPPSGECYCNYDFTVPVTSTPISTPQAPQASPQSSPQTSPQASPQSIPSTPQASPQTPVNSPMVSSTPNDVSPPVNQQSPSSTPLGTPINSPTQPIPKAPQSVVTPADSGNIPVTNQVSDGSKLHATAILVVIVVLCHWYLL